MSDRTQILPANSEAVEELVPQTLTLGNSGEATILDLLSIHLERVFGEAETLLNESGKFTDPTALLTQDFLGVCSTDNNLAEHNMFRSPRNFRTLHLPQCERESLGHHNQSIPPRRVPG